MKKTLTLVLISLAIFSCKKFIQQQEENYVVKIMTSGVWYVSAYNQNDTTNFAPLFNAYTFQFLANGTVLAIKDSATVATGTWVGDVNNKTINSNFSGATDPLVKLNSLWKITDSGSDYVKATTVIGSNNEYLYLRKE
jgi:hypothetical protein